MSGGLDLVSGVQTSAASFRMLCWHLPGINELLTLTNGVWMGLAVRLTFELFENWSSDPKFSARLGVI